MLYTMMKDRKLIRTLVCICFLLLNTFLFAQQKVIREVPSNLTDITLHTAGLDHITIPRTWPFPGLGSFIWTSFALPGVWIWMAFIGFPISFWVLGLILAEDIFPKISPLWVTGLPKEPC